MSEVDKILTGLCSEEKLIEYISGNDFELAKAAASAPNATNAVLSLGAIDKDSSIRLIVLKNKNCTSEIIAKLVKDSDAVVSDFANKLKEEKSL